MYTTYVLKSLKARRFYTGFTENLERRLNEHNSGKSSYTKRFMPWEVIFSKHFPEKQEAIKYEKYLKSNAGRVWLKNKFRL